MSKKKRTRRPSSAAPAAVAPVSGAAAETFEASPESDSEGSDTQATAEGGDTAQDASRDHVTEPTESTPTPTPIAEPRRASDDSRSDGPRLQQSGDAGAMPSWTMHESGDVRGVLIQVAGGRLLLPNATIAEVLSYAEPENTESGADWLLGRFRWRGWQLPLIAFSRLAGIGEDKPGLGSKVIVLKALSGERHTPFFAIVTQGFPRLVTVSRASLGVESRDGPLPPGVQAYVRLNDEPALLPDLAQIEEQLRQLHEAA